MIKFLDLQKLNAQYEQELKEAANRVIDSGWYVMGKELESFEQDYAAFCGTKYALGVANGLDALRLIFKAYMEMGVMHKGDEVGGARISTKHVLALTNSGDATASDIAELAKRARDHVKEKFGITLEAEVNLVGVEI